MKIEINKKYKTRDGGKARIYITNGKEPYPVHGAYSDPQKEEWIMNTWTLQGFNDKDGTQTDLDLIEVKEKKQLTGFVNCYANGLCSWYEEKYNADKSAAANRIACIDLSQYGIFYEVGEGL